MAKNQSMKADLAFTGEEIGRVCASSYDLRKEEPVGRTLRDPDGAA
jgi:hypothetical protein